MDQAFRFDREDTLVFHLTLQNKTLKLIEFTPERLQLKVGNYSLFPSLTQIGNAIPPNSSMEGYVAFTGTADGERNDLSLKNDFTFVLERTALSTDELPIKDDEGAQK